LPSQSAGASHRATSHTRLRLLLAGAVVACLALPTRQARAQPARELNPQRPAPPSRDGSHDFDFLEGTWQLSDAPADYHTLGPYGRLVVRILAPRTATVEWYTREPDPAPDSGFMRMSYDPASHQWMIHEAASQTASPEPPLVGSFEHGIGSFIGPRKRDGRLVLARLTWTFNGLGNERLEWAFSADSGTTWKTQRALGLSRVSTSPARRSAFEGTCCPRVEVVWYSVPAGKDEQLIDLFARESRAMGDSIRVQDVALFRDADRPGVFALVRGFDRERPTDDYYRGPAWTAHRAALDRAGIRVDSLIELMTDRRPWGFIVGERAAADMPAKARGLVVATVYTLDQHRPDHFYILRLLRSVRRASNRRQRCAPAGGVHVRRLGIRPMDGATVRERDSRATDQPAADVLRIVHVVRRQRVVSATPEGTRGRRVLALLGDAGPNAIPCRATSNLAARTCRPLARASGLARDAAVTAGLTAHHVISCDPNSHAPQTFVQTEQNIAKQ